MRDVPEAVIAQSVQDALALESAGLDNAVGLCAGEFIGGDSIGLMKECGVEQSRT